MNFARIDAPHGFVVVRGSGTNGSGSGVAPGRLTDPLGRSLRSGNTESGASGVLQTSSRPTSRSSSARVPAVRSRLA